MYPKPAVSEAIQSHEYCRDASCKKLLGIFPRDEKEIEFNKPLEKVDMSKQPRLTIERMRSVFGGPNTTAFVAKGSYGSVFKMYSNSAFKKYIQTNVVPKSKSVIGSADKLPTNGKMIALKLQIVPDNEHLKAIQVENKIHKKLWKTKITNIFYVGGLIGNIFWQLSSYIDGVSMCKVQMNSAVFEKIEKSVYKLWKKRIFHADLHCNNLMLTDKGDVVIIDFGRAIILPEKLAPSTFEQFKKQVFQEKVQTYANKIITKRAKTQEHNYVRAKVTKKYKVEPVVTYSDDVQALRVFFDKLPKTEQMKLK